MPASLILVLARTSLWPMAAGAMRKARGDCRRIEAEDGLEDERCPDLRLDRGMGASEHERQADVGDGFLLRFGCPKFIGDEPHMRSRLLTGAPSPGQIDGAPSRHRDKPRLGPVGMPLAGQPASAAAKASARASSAAATSRVRAARKAKSLP